MILGAKLLAPSISLISTNFWSSGTDALFQQGNIDQNQWSFGFAVDQSLYEVSQNNKGWLISVFPFFDDFIVCFGKLCLLRLQHIVSQFKKAQDYLLLQLKNCGFGMFLQHRSVYGQNLSIVIKVCYRKSICYH